MTHFISTTIIWVLLTFFATGQILDREHILETKSETKENPNQEKMKSLKIERHFNAMPEKVFAAFTNPETMKAWWTEDTVFDIDLRVGGHYTITREENGVKHRMTGKYLEVKQPYKLKYTCAMPDFSPITDTISIEIQPVGEKGSKMIFIQQGEGIHTELKELPEGAVSESEKGWQLGFDLMEQSSKNH